MTQTDVAQAEPDPRLIGKPAQLSVRFLVDGELVGEVTSERPNEVEARALCLVLQREIRRLVDKDKGYVQ